MSQPYLARPDMRYQASYLDAMREKIAEGDKPDWNLDKLDAHFDEYVQVILERESDPLPGLVPASDYWLIAEDSYAGRISLRHHLTPALRRYGGHIGYEVRPSRRRRGYGTLMCKLGIEKLRALGVQRILITCDDDNIASYKIIEANGGILEDKIENGRHALTRRYWVG